MKMQNVSGKIWGTTASLFCRNNVEIHRIEIKGGGYCSRHRHNNKVNVFYVESGELEIQVEKKDYNLTDKTVLKAGDMCEVKAGEYHRFIARKPTVCYEIYYVQLDTNDIERKDVGGRDHAGHESH